MSEKTVSRGKDGDEPTGERKIGVYICHCGGNISDYVDVDRVLEAVKDEPGVVVARTAMFTCSDATQQEMVQDIQEKKLDGLVVASCSPKLHQFTFRETAKRGELNPYQYTQVNIREQCSWAHTDDKAGATRKAIRLVRAGIARTRLSQALTPMVVDTVPRALVVGAGIAGLRAAISLADIGLEVIVVEKEAEPGGRVAGLGKMYPSGRSGKELVERLLGEVKKRPRITLFTGAELTDKGGSFGNFQVRIRVDGETIQAEVGTVIVATGSEDYQPREGEFGFGLDGVITLPEFERLAVARGPIIYRGRPVKTIAYIYCVGSRQGREVEGGNHYCSRFCCNAAGHASVMVAARDPGVRQYHLYRDIRTYGPFESIFSESRRNGSVYVKFDPAEPPVVTGKTGGAGGPRVRVKDLLTAGEELEIPADLVVLVTGMVPRDNENLVRALKLPIGRDGFYNEIHPKLRPVETVVDGVLICGTCQGPKNSAESVASSLAAAAQSAAILKKGYAELEPLVAVVDPAKCDDCGKCYPACPFEAIERVGYQVREVASVNRAVCKGCGACVPVCPAEAIDLLGYTDKQVRAMIDGLLKETA
jgi:heterodisulfide reductase subunit A